MFRFILINLFFLLFIGLSTTWAQEPLECDHPDRDTTQAESLPWFGNNDYLEHFLDSIGYPSAGARIVGPDRVRYHVPIKFWVYRSSAGVGGPTLVQLQQYIDNLNHLYNVANQTFIGFYMKCDVGFINDDTHVNVESDFEAGLLMAAHNEKGCINIHVVNNLSDNVLGVTYRSRRYSQGIFLNHDTYDDAFFNSTIAHEVGHYFELDHTHQYSDRGKCRKEAIRRDRNWPFIMFCPFGGGGPHSQAICEATGDFLRDTPADPNLISNPFNGLCTYNLLGLTDPWGDHYESPPTGSLMPDPTNLMSYSSNRPCRDHFSRLQIAVMLHSIVRGNNKYFKAGWEDAKAEYDDYETDNDAQTARPIVFGEVQEHNFHQQYTDENYLGQPIWTMCDVDWVRFVSPCNATLHVFTSALPGRITADTRITLFDAGLNQLAQNDNISASNFFSDITWNFQAGVTYLIRVDNMITDQNRYYDLQIGYASSISGNPVVCSSEVFSVPAVAGATYTWTPTTSAFATFTPNGNSVTVNRSGTSKGTITLTATINGPCGTSSISGFVEVGSNFGPVDFGGQPDPLCQGNVFNAYANTQPYSGYLWTAINGQIVSGQGTYEVHASVDQLPYWQTTGTFGLALQAYDACGEALPLAIKYSTVNSCSGGGIESKAPKPSGKKDEKASENQKDLPLRIYPNPARAYVTIEAPRDFVGGSINILSQDGQLLKHFTIVNTITKLDLQNLPSGVYLLQSASKTGRIDHKKIVLTH